MSRSNERGVALVFTLFLMAALSAMAVSMMFLAQTETSASRNYKTMSQARYAGEAGVQRAIHYLSSTAYTNAVTTTGFNMAVSPVTLTANGNPVVLTPVAANSNHPDTTIKNAFAALFSGATLPVGSNNATATYSATATLLSMRPVTVYGGGSGVIQTWRIAATGKVQAGVGTVPATVEVGAILERGATFADTYAIFATGTGCGAVTLAGGAETNSYDSSPGNLVLSGGVPVTQNNGGAVGTNGNLRLVGNQTTVHGNLDTPRTGVGSCNNGNITALDGNEPAVGGDIIKLPQAKTYPDPAAPSPAPPQTALNISSASCAGLGPLPTPPYFVLPDTCVASGSTITITKGLNTPISWGNVAVSGTTNIVINSTLGTGTPVKLNVNSFSLSGNSTISLGTNTAITMNIAGTGVTGDVADFTGGSMSNSSFDSSRFQILYAGTQRIKLKGGSQASAVVYAPNAPVAVGGGTGFYGSILANTFDGGSDKLEIHYDRALASKFFMLQNHVMSSFSWQKY